MTETRKQIAVIVGGTSGLGLETARIFAANGSEVILGSHTQEKLDKAATSLPEVRALKVDVTDGESVEAFVRNIGQFDHLVVTASGAFADKPLKDTAIEDLKVFAETKLWGVLRCIKASAPYISSGGSITLISGAVARKGRAGAHAKTITNSALEGITRSLAVEMGPGIRVNCISPGIFDSKGAMASQKKEEVAQMYPGRYVGNSSDVGGMIYAVAQNQFMTGSVIYIDSGWTAT